MKTEKNARRLCAVVVVLLVMVGALPLCAQQGKLNVHARPSQAYVFVDGNAMGQANHALTLPAGEHKVTLQNYGYRPVTQTVTISPNATTNLDINLEALTDTVSGPWGAITLEGAKHDAVFLNGKTPDFFVGHGDEFNHDWWWKQELVVPPGTYQLTVMNQGKEIWSGPVEVPANQRVVVDVPKGVRKTVAWSRGEKLASVPRFRAGTASATVAVAKPTAQFSAQALQINCGESSTLKWASSDAPGLEITGIGPVGASGEQAVQPKQTTTYELRATGPGGTATSNATVTVNNAIQAQLGLSPAELRYKRVGDKVVEQNSTALNWSVSNANAVSVEPFGSVDVNGTRSVQVVPRKTDVGAIDETMVYTLTASNPCGGSETRTATLHIVGSIEAEPMITMHSVYFPTDRPTARMKTGLVPSQQERLKAVADAFKTYLTGKPDARLVLTGHADRRGPKAYNQALSERRAELAKKFLTEQGVPAEAIETQGYGEEHNLNAEAVKESLQQNQELSDEARQAALRRMTTMVLAHNRRVDVVLKTTGQESLRDYPFKADDSTTLLKRGGLAKEGL